MCVMSVYACFLCVCMCVCGRWVCFCINELCVMCGWMCTLVRWRSADVDDVVCGTCQSLIPLHIKIC